MLAFFVAVTVSIVSLTYTATAIIRTTWKDVHK